MLKLLSTGLFGLIAATGYAQAAGTGSTVTFQGDVFIDAAPSACGTTATVGDYYRILYRAKVATSDPADALVFVGGRSAFRILSTSSSGSLNGSSTTSNAYFSSYGDFNSGISGTSSLTFASFTSGISITNSGNIKVTGTVTSFYNVAGCDITIRAALTKRTN